MRTKRFLAASATVVFVLCFTIFAVGSDNVPTRNKVADVSIGSSGILWQPKVSCAKITLAVACPDGQVFSKTFDSGAAPYFGLSDLKGEISDGSYTYELRVIPFTEKRERKGGSATKGEKPVYPKTLVQSGYFHVRGGSIATGGAQNEDPVRPLDIVHLDDVIIDGSLCVGNDCYSGLAFGFDTIVLMENNLRIFFDDTSTIQNYPRNDWRIICNDSTDGGGNYFAVQDATDVSTIFVLEAGAPDNSLYVDSHGDVGINTSTPYY
ncbi:MAG: hypothetical protein KAT34_22860, partial [Candidatus Aminicenantes bacterium]|nr:hypothetical protein [Candidatus Aminicenantes bacterium]